MSAHIDAAVYKCNMPQQNATSIVGQAAKTSQEAQLLLTNRPTLLLYGESLPFIGLIF